MKYWKDVSLEFMSEESDDPDNPNVLIIHKLPWRSRGNLSWPYNIIIVIIITCSELSQFLETLDERYEKKIKKEGVLVARKQRRVGSTSVTIPQCSAPKWTVDEEWAKGIVVFFCLFCNDDYLPIRKHGTRELMYTFVKIKVNCAKWCQLVYKCSVQV